MSYVEVDPKDVVEMAEGKVLQLEKELEENIVDMKVLCENRSPLPREPMMWKLPVIEGLKSSLHKAKELLHTAAYAQVKGLVFKLTCDDYYFLNGEE